MNRTVARDSSRFNERMKTSSIATGAGNGAVSEIKEWQAIMDHLRSLSIRGKDKLPLIPVDERAAEVRAIKVG